MSGPAGLGYQPKPGRSVRPPDLQPQEREALRRAAGELTRRRRMGELPVLVLVALLLAFVIKGLLVQAFYIPSGSMQDTLLIDDRVLVEKVSYRFRDPERGEIIVFRRPGAEVGRGPGAIVTSFLEGLGIVAPDADIDLIKRVIGLPGETVEVRGGVVHVDGVALDEPYVRADGRDFPAVRVPEDHYFMLGDNRGNSDDSRYSLGTIPRDAVVGRAFTIMWPPVRATLQMDHDYPAAGER
jgi:signal peptidase I